MDFEGIIFDLDGTLVDSLDDIIYSMNKVLKENGLPTHSYEDYRYFIGDGLRKLVLRALPKNYRDEKNVSIFLKRMMDEYSNHCTVETKLFVGIDKLLNELTTKGIKLAIFSNKVDELTKFVASTLLSKWDFEVVIGSRDKYPHKPNPQIANIISDEMMIPQNKIIFVGDTGIDMKTASSAGMYGVGVLWGYRTKEELIESGAREVIRHPLELLNIVR